MTNAQAADRWKKEIYNSRFSSLLRRAFIVLWATSKVGTPYGFGCKLTGRDYGTCADVPKDDPSYVTRVDCSGLVAYAYGMVGFTLFHDRTANEQMNEIGKHDFGSYPSPETVKLGDLNFWCCTQKSLTDQQSSHVGIYLSPGRWIAAQGDPINGEVNIYNNNSFWQSKFLKHGSVLKY
jgi:cell wall-associated NlpC family hydrolase